MRNTSLFFYGSKKNIRCLLHIFKSCSEVLGQFLNYDKSKIFTGTMTASRKLMLVNFCVFSVGAMLFQYLGCPIF